MPAQKFSLLLLKSTERHSSGSPFSMSLYLTEVDCHPCHGYSMLQCRQLQRHRGAMLPPRPLPFPTFLRSKKKKGRQKQKRKCFKAETIKRLSPRSKYYYFSHSRASRIRKSFLSVNHGGQHYFPVFHGPPTLKSISPALTSLLLLLIVSFVGYFA